MVTTEEVIEILDFSEEYVIVDVHIVRDGLVCGYLTNDIDPRRPYRVVAHTLAETQSVTICITSIAKTRNRAISKALERARAWLNHWCIGIDPRRAVTLRYQEDIDLSPAQLVILLDKMITFIHLFELQVTFYTMLDSGVYRTIVKQIMSTFHEWKNKSTILFRDVL